MMSVQAAYEQWADHYDTNRNWARDLEAAALRELLAGRITGRVLELGCGTGKNTVWLAEHAQHVTAVDFSPAMLAEARKKVQAPHVAFIEADLLQPWTWQQPPYDVAIFSLVLEHMADAEALIRQAAALVAPAGWLYVAELHPFKQYQGATARYDTPEGEQRVTAYTHDVSEFVQAALNHGLTLRAMREPRLPDDAEGPPRVLALLFQRV